MRFLNKKLDAYIVYLCYSSLFAFAQSLVFLMSMVYQIEVVKLNPLQLVLVGTTLEVTAFLCQVPTGVLADVYSRRLAVIVGVLLMGVGFLLFGLVSTFGSVLAAQILWGAGVTFTTGAEEAWVAEEIRGIDTGKVFIRGSQVGQLAALVSIPVGVILATLQISLPIIVGACLFLVLAAFLFCSMPEQHFQPTLRSERSTWRAMGQMMVDGGRAVRKSYVLLLILAITAFAAMASEGFDRLSTDHFIKDYHFPDLWHLSSLTWFGIISIGSSILGLIASELIRRWVDTTKQRVVVLTLFVFEMLLIVSVATFALAGNFYLALAAFWSAGIFRGTAHPLYNTWMTQSSTPRMRATIISMFGQIDAIGQIAGGPFVGFIGTVVSLRAALLVTSVILSPTMLFFALALRLRPPLPQAEAEEDTVIASPSH